MSLLIRSVGPQLILTEATKSVRVSHWGFLAVDDYYALENIGAKLKGEFSRVDFHKKQNGMNCMRQINAKYPWYVQNMYFNDFIGNISSTNAIRKDDSVEVDFYGRFPVCGGWKSDWNTGFQVPTKYHLSRVADTKDTYALEMPFLHNYDVLLAENYTVEYILPYGASEINVSPIL